MLTTTGRGQQQFLTSTANYEPGSTSKGHGLENAAYRRYKRKSGEEALLEHKLKQKRCAASLEYFLKKDPRDTRKNHNQHLIKQSHKLTQPSRHCNNNGCENKCLPFSVKCSRHICDDSKQLLYTKCSYIYPSGIQCTNPIPKYLDPLLCGGHCDNIAPPECAPEFRDASNSSQDLPAKLEESTTEAQSTEKEEKGQDELITNIEIPDTDTVVK